MLTCSKNTAAGLDLQRKSDEEYALEKTQQKCVVQALH